MTTTNTLITLREVNADTVRDICRLSVAESQKGFVAPNAVSIAEAYFCDKAWFRAIYADELPVGFVMLYDDPQDPEGPVYYLWRFMIAAEHQGKGYGRSAMELLIERGRNRPGAVKFELSCVPAEGGAEPFYEKFGFKRNGKWEDDEVCMEMAFQ
ncbi:MAG TPA: GNAT family N-acetyltransferase [Firmicutes bacterium]|jgi:diamine N-acetyltransferase|nr:GNAT family N-acetyltransferase [Bacillota bacterium]HAZ21757.1 GNAT family N-acetyltransferase [Bacillota bacterium]HBE06203.1 GNAT family N-acetyltransferase [Bacillota bacterium]HBG43508.1 GNAT family N-acetyltransferase [Bacillota bacterium]HBL49603.1 GNAT family N-acetyltransferase [Bacillota bacterium]